jgi:hypothetical protein
MAALAGNLLWTWWLVGSIGLVDGERGTGVARSIRGTWREENVSMYCRQGKISICYSRRETLMHCWRIGQCILRDYVLLKILDLKVDSG